MTKLFVVGSKTAWGLCGSKMVMDRMNSGFQGQRTTLDAGSDPLRVVGDVVRPIASKAYAEYVPAPNDPHDLPVSALGFSAVVATMRGARPVLATIDGRGVIEELTEVESAAVGSGKAMASVATALVSHYEHAEHPVHYGLLAAWRVVNAVIEVSTDKVGPPIKLAIITADGARLLTNDEVDEVGRNVGVWQQIEQEALDTFMSKTSDQAPTPMPARRTETRA